MTDSAVPPPENPTTQLQLWPSRRSALVWIGALGACVAAGYFLLQPRSPADSAAAKERWLKELATHNAEFSQFLDEARRTTDWENAQRSVLALQQTLKQLEQETQALDEEFRRLATTDVGRAIAAQPERVRQFAALRSSERMSPTEIANYATDIPKYLAICEQALTDKTIIYDPQQSLTGDVDAALKSVETQLRQVQQDRAALQALVQAAGQGAPAGTTLAQAADALEQAAARQLLEQLTAEKQRLQQESNARIREAELDAEQKRLAAEERVRIAAAQAAADQAEQLAAAREREVAEQRAAQQKLAEFRKQLPRMRDLLSPIITSGRMQLDTKGRWYEDEPGPLSLAVLKPLCYGQLKTPSTFALMNALSNYNRNDRPRGSWPPANNDEAPTANRAAQFILDYGDLLVQEQLLRP